MSESDTPRTDAAAFSPGTGNQWEDVVDADFARQLERELAEARKDAERYRWLRTLAWVDQLEFDSWYWCTGVRANRHDELPEEFDAAIDAAMASDPPAK